MPLSRILFISVLLACLFPIHTQAQRKKKKKTQSQESYTPYAPSLYQALSWRNVGPHRGGRSTTACGVPSDPHTFYFGSTGGGVWKTTNGGATWKNISDGYVKTGSVGAIAVAPSDPNVLYVGMGEAPVRGVMTSHGDGVYKSTDAGQSWKQVGLSDVRQISKVRIDPRNPDIVYVAAQGSPYQPTSARGIYRTSDGGGSWEKVLFVDEKSGACDLSMDARNPRILYAAFWEHQRLPWKVLSGGPGSSIWKSTDGGTNWTKLTNGLPRAMMGKIGISVSPANPSRVWAIIESNEGGLYRSDNGGHSWKLINDKRVLRARSWYYMHIFAHPTDPDHVVVLNAPYMQSTDGGATFKTVSTPHGDNHDLWFHPENPQIMINANDGGANISYNGGQTWSIQSNQPTAQFYRVNADNRFPYYLYGGQQDNSSLAIPNQTQNGGISNEDFYRLGGCESAYCAFDPDDPSHVYAGCYQGIIVDYDVEMESSKDIMAYPYLGLGSNPAKVKYRFNWNAPILLSQHDKSVLYHAGNVLLKSTDQGNSWSEISPDLTRNVAEHLDWGGGPITNEGAGGEVYHTIMYVAESPHDANVIWTGADDGLIHLTKDGGKSWTNVSPPNVEEGIANCIEVSPFDPATAYVAYTRYKFNDFTPHIFQTNDFGQSWQRTVTGIDEEAHVRVVRADPNRRGLLYAGTETGMYLSFDEGQHWESFQLNLPVVPITDLKVHQNDLVAATQGRAFWVLDDLTPLHQLYDGIGEENVFFYQPQDAYLFGGSRNDSSLTRGTNPDPGVVMYYYLKDKQVEVHMDILDEEGEVIRSYSSSDKKNKAATKAGMNKLVWDFQYPAFESIKGLMPYGRGGGTYSAGPGTYRARLITGGDSSIKTFKVFPDPREKASETMYQHKSALQRQVAKAIDDIYLTVKDMRHAKSQIKRLLDRFEEGEEKMVDLVKSGEAIMLEMDELETQLIQVKQKTFQDVINFPNQLDANLRHILGLIEGAQPPVTKGQEARVADLLGEWKVRKATADDLLGERLDAFNQQVREADIPFVGRRE
ncbi:MAG: glycosyl hydrolase [Bacteroidota bacterium]